MPFVKGKSGNPGGRKPVPEAIKLALEAACPKAVQVLVGLLDSADEGIRLKASTTIIERKLGKAAQAVELSSDGVVLNFQVIHPKEG